MLPHGELLFHSAGSGGWVAGFFSLDGRRCVRDWIYKNKYEYERLKISDSVWNSSLKFRPNVIAVVRFRKIWFGFLQPTRAKDPNRSSRRPDDSTLGVFFDSFITSSFSLPTNPFQGKMDPVILHDKAKVVVSVVDTRQGGAVELLCFRNKQHVKTSPSDGFAFATGDFRKNLP